MTATNEAGSGEGREGGSSPDTAGKRTVRLPNGDIHEVSHEGWSEVPGGRVHISRGGTVTLLMGEATRASSPGGAPYLERHYPNHVVNPDGTMRVRPGARIALKHGARSPATVDPIAEELVSSTLEAAPFLSEPSFRPALLAWARSEARCLLLERWLDEHGLLDEQGNPRPATALMTQQENLALKHRTRLGLDAASRAGIEASLTSTAASQASLEAALEAGAAALRDRLGAGRVPGTPQEDPGAPTGSPQPTGGRAAAGGAEGPQIATGGTP